MVHDKLYKELAGKDFPIFNVSITHPENAPPFILVQLSGIEYDCPEKSFVIIIISLDLSADKSA